MLNKKIIITNHAIERFEERKRERIVPSKLKKWEADQRKYLISQLRPLNIKSIVKKPSGITIVNTKGNYRFVIKETPTEAIVKTVMRTNDKKIKKGY